MDSDDKKSGKFSGATAAFGALGSIGKKVLAKKDAAKSEDGEITESKVMQVLDWAYDKACNGVVGLDSAQELAAPYLNDEGELVDKVNALIRWQNTKAGTSGFITGLGGIITLPVAIPANISSVIFIQVRMIAAIAHMGGYDLKDDRVKTLVYTCLTGNAAKDIVKNIGITISTKMTNTLIKNISGETIKAINKAVGFRLITKFGQKGAINLGKAIPLVGGVVGATFDSVSTNTIGNISRNIFIEEKYLNDVCMVIIFSSDF